MTPAPVRSLPTEWELWEQGELRLKSMRVQETKYLTEKYISPPDASGLNHSPHSSPSSHPPRAACAVIQEAEILGVTLKLSDGFIEWAALAVPPATFIDRLRFHKAELFELLRGNRCRQCGQRMAWPDAAGVVFADSTAECRRCTDAEIERLHTAAERALAGVLGVSDEGEFLRPDDEP